MREPATKTCGNVELAPNSAAAPAVRDRFSGVEVPMALQASLDRHRENLARLVRSLQVAGVDEARIESSVGVLVDSYKNELLDAIKAIMEQRFD